MTESLQGGSTHPSEKRRSQRILLRIPILVRAQFEDGLPIKEDAVTLEVNAHGALITLAMKVRAGQKLVLRNWATAEEQECRVVHVREVPGGKNEVGVSFPFPIPRFWHIQFPPPDWMPFMG
jgi:PilZ domain-containing protein